MTNLQVLVGCIIAKQQLKTWQRTGCPMTIEAHPAEQRIPSAFVTLKGKWANAILNAMMKGLEEQITICYEQVQEDEERR